MKKLYSKKLGGEAFALDAAQLDILKKAGYTVPSPEEVKILFRSHKSARRVATGERKEIGG